MKHQISKKERAALTIAGAQRIAGLGNTPTARQVRKAHDQAGCAVAKHGVVVKGGADSTDGLVNNICGKLSGIGGETDAECGGFSDAIKNTVVSMVPFASLASAGVTSAVAVKQLKSRPQQQQVQAPAPAAPAAAPAMQSTSDDSNSGYMGTEMSRPEKGYVYLFGDDELGAYAEIEDDELFGDSLGYEDALLAREVGGADAAAISRMRGWPGRTRSFPMARRLPAPPTTQSGASIPHVAYRAMILKQARSIGGSSPTAKQMASAQANVDAAMAKKNVSVAIPGARPGRVTR